MTTTILNEAEFPTVTPTAPSLAMGRVVLTVHDLDRVKDFYEKAVGLHLLKEDGSTAAFGVGSDVLLELRADTSARRRSPREAGLFHTAFLLPSRMDLARWTRHASTNRVLVVGAADHGVSEALYLSDPEGNGVEIYADRPTPTWKWKDAQVEMPSDPLDMQDLMASAGDGQWAGFPIGSSVGHVHLQVGAIPAAEAFYSGVLGLGITCRYPGGTFYAVDGYHHHLATNVWNSRRAAPRSYPSTGLAEVQIRVDPARAVAIADRAGKASEAVSSFSLRDPWETVISIVAVSPTARKEP